MTLVQAVDPPNYKPHATAPANAPASYLYKMMSIQEKFGAEMSL